MGKSIKFKDEVYLDSSSIQCNGKQKSLQKYLTNQNTFYLQATHNSSIPVYHKIVRLPATSTGSYDVVRIHGFLGAWESTNKCSFKFIVGNRNGLAHRGHYSGWSYAFAACNFECYKEDDGAVVIYFVKKAQYTGGCLLNIEYDGTSTVPCNTSPTTPTGTKVLTIDSSNMDGIQYLRDRIASLETKTNVVDYTSQCTYPNGSYVAGKVYKIGRIVYVQMSITSTITSTWGTILKVPAALYPLKTYDNGCPVGSSWWVYGTNAGNGAGNVRGTLENGKNYSLVFSYIAES